jgi:hypothetical protein
MTMSTEEKKAMDEAEGAAADKFWLTRGGTGVFFSRQTRDPSSGGAPPDGESVAAEYYDLEYTWPFSDEKCTLQFPHSYRIFSRQFEILRPCI